MTDQLKTPLTAPVETERSLRTAALALTAAGAALTTLGAATDPARLPFGYLWAFAFVWTVVLGCLFFVALQHLTRSVWSVVIRRVPEAIAAQIWLVALLFLPVVGLAWHHGTFQLFPWTDRAAVAADPVLAGKQAYLNLPAFTLRALGFFAVWGLFARHFVGRSLAQDRGRVGDEATITMRRRAAVFTVLFGLTITFAAFDWLMSLTPHWFSTIFGVYVFSGMFVVAIATITLGVLYLRARGRLGDGLVGDRQLLVLGMLLFGMSCFWAYIAFSQTMLIWYANLPEETEHLLTRWRGPWLAVSWLLGILRFFVPFFLLLARTAKTNPRTLALGSLLCVAGQLLDLYWLIMPEAPPARSAWHAAELGPVLLLGGLVLLGVVRFLGRHSALALRDPWLQQSVSVP
jgi:hypothetical protein